MHPWVFSGLEWLSDHKEAGDLPGRPETSKAGRPACDRLLRVRCPSAVAFHSAVKSLWPLGASLRALQASWGGPRSFLEGSTVALWSCPGAARAMIYNP